MRFILVAAILLGSAFNLVAAQCTNPQVRREWSELTPELKKQYVKAVKDLANRPFSDQTTDPSKMSYADFVSTHTKYAYWAHVSAQFLVYHRGMLHMWDQALRSVGWNYGPLYWDWTLASQSFMESELFNYFGTVGKGPNNCLQDGEFAQDKFKVSVSPPTANRTPQNQNDPTYRALPTVESDQYGLTCVRRCSDWTKGVLWDPVAIRDALASQNNYDSFRNLSDSTGWHAGVHQVVGGRYDDLTTCGDMADPSWSTNDPIFFLHHGMVDKTWWRWQTLCPSFRKSYNGFYNMNNGNSPDPAAGPNNPQGVADVSNQLDSWPFKVSDVLDTQSGVLCYTYSRSPSDLPTRGQCPAGETSGDGVPPIAGPITPGGGSSVPTEIQYWFHTLIINLFPNPNAAQSVNGSLASRSEAPARRSVALTQEELDAIRARKPHPFPVAPEYAGVKSFTHPDFPEIEVHVPEGHHVSIGRYGKPIVVPSVRPNASSPHGYGSFPRVTVKQEVLAKRMLMNGGGLMNTGLVNSFKIVGHKLDKFLTETGNLTLASGHTLYQRPFDHPIPTESDDKSETGKLRYATVLSNEFVAMMGLDEKIVREADAVMMAAVDRCNKKAAEGEGCDSPALLKNVRNLGGMVSGRLESLAGDHKAGLINYL
ncbi:hypothetical protein HDU97_009261 [Phlyctochytrium planicorne]|nr:hypothetical protein HDU97_009261 [Phlyctochytrium planicorne]